MITINIPIWPLVFALGWFAGVVSLLLLVWMVNRRKAKGEGDET